MTATDGIAVHHGNDRLRQRSYLFLYFQDVQFRHAGVIHVAAATFDVHVASGAKRLVPGAGQQNHAHLAVSRAVAEGIGHFRDGERSEGVAKARAIDGDARNAVVKVKANFFVVFYFCPSSHEK